jgi:hypothetical protein
MTKKILGIPVVVFVLALMVVGGASAALVSYLSNTTTVSVSVESPLLVRVAPETGGTWETSQNLGTVYGGDTVNWRTRVDNRANAVINGDLVSSIDNGLGTTSCSDFTSLMIYDPGTSSWVDVMPLCTDTAGQAVITIPVAYLALESETYQASMTFNPAVIPADYVVSSQVMV